jgi:hypothetical protein
MLKRSASNVFFLAIFLGIPIYFWLLAIGTKLKNENYKPNFVTKIIFKISIFYPIIYYVFAIFNFIINGGFINSLHFAAMFSTFFAMLFAAKILKSAELKKEAVVSDYLGDFFLIWFYPIGIWILQPRIHKLKRKKQ